MSWFISQPTSAVFSDTGQYLAQLVSVGADVDRFVLVDAWDHDVRRSVLQRQREVVSVDVDGAHRAGTLEPTVAGIGQRPHRGGGSKVPHWTLASPLGFAGNRSLLHSPRMRPDTVIGPWSPLAGPAHDLDADGDQLGNGIFDDIVGCPIPPPPTPPIGPPCSYDPSKIAAVYPAGHAEAYNDANSNCVYDAGESFIDINRDGTWTADLGGHPTGGCFPPGHMCLSELCPGTGS